MMKKPRKTSNAERRTPSGARGTRDIEGKATMAIAQRKYRIGFTAGSEGTILKSGYWNSQPASLR